MTGCPISRISGGVQSSSLISGPLFIMTSRRNTTLILIPSTAVDCEYDMKRNKTGMKPGAIENLHRKIGMPGFLSSLHHPFPL